MFCVGLLFLLCYGNIIDIFTVALVFTKLKQIFLLFRNDQIELLGEMRFIATRNLATFVI